MIPTPAQQAHSDAIRLALQELGDQRVTVSVTRKPFLEPLNRLASQKKGEER